MFASCSSCRIDELVNRGGMFRIEGCQVMPASLLTKKKPPPVAVLMVVAYMRLGFSRSGRIELVKRPLYPPLLGAKFLPPSYETITP
jgi:hypothetical protein